MNFQRRTKLAKQLLEQRSSAESVIDIMHQRHPEIQRLLGDQSREISKHDTLLYLAYLAAAVQVNDSHVFADHISWTAHQMREHQQDPTLLRETLELFQQLIFSNNGSSSSGESAPTSSILPNSTERLIIEKIITDGLQALQKPHQESTQGRENQAEDHAAQMVYLTASLAGEKEHALELCTQLLKMGWTTEKIYRQLLLWSQNRIGDLWAMCEVSVAQEHIASMVTQFVMAHMYKAIERPLKTKGTVLIAGVEGELHTLPAHFASDLLEMKGWDVRFCGTHLPNDNIITMIEETGPDVVGLSTTMVFNIPTTVELTEKIRARFSSLPIVLGGRAWASQSQLAKELGVQIDTTQDFSAFDRL